MKQINEQVYSNTSEQMSNFEAGLEYVLQSKRHCLNYVFAIFEKNQWQTSAQILAVLKRMRPVPNFV